MERELQRLANGPLFQHIAVYQSGQCTCTWDHERTTRKKWEVFSWSQEQDLFSPGRTENLDAQAIWKSPQMVLPQEWRIIAPRLRIVLVLPNTCLKAIPERNKLFLNKYILERSSQCLASKKNITRKRSRKYGQCGEKSFKPKLIQNTNVRISMWWHESTYYSYVSDIQKVK